MRYGFLKIGSRDVALLYSFHEAIEAAKSIDLLGLTDLGSFQRILQNPDCLVVRLQRDGERMAVFAAVSE